MISLRPILCAIALTGSGACAPDSNLRDKPDVARMSQTAPPGAEPGTCWGKEITPAIIETVTQQIVVQPARVQDDGTVLQPAVYRTETSQEIVRERRESWFERPCDTVMTAEFLSSLQRALAARGFYRGPVNGEMDKPTRAAVRRYQEPLGLDSGILSLAAARKLGLVAVELRTAG